MVNFTAYKLYLNKLILKDRDLFLKAKKKPNILFFLISTSSLTSVSIHLHTVNNFSDRLNDTLLNLSNVINKAKPWSKRSLLQTKGLKFTLQNFNNSWWSQRG